MTQQQILHQAIERAEGAGSCRYTRKNNYKEPCCVIAQLAFLADPDALSILAAYDANPEYDADDNDDGMGTSIGVILAVKNEKILEDYPRHIMIELQGIWDRGVHDDPDSTPEERRDLMHQSVAVYYQNYPEQEGA